MAERSWVKLWSSYWTSNSHAIIGADALLVGAVLMSAMRWTPGDLDAWAVDEQDAPLPEALFAIRSQLPARRVSVALAKLEMVGTLKRRADGAWGMPKFGRYQESADAARKRKAPRKPDGSSAEVPALAEAEADAEADANSLRSSTPTPPPSELFDLESKPTKPGKAKKPKPQPDGRIEQVLAAIDAERARRDPPLPPLTETQRSATTIAAAFGRGATVERLLECVGAWGRYSDRDPSKASMLNPAKLFSGPNHRTGFQGGLSWCEDLLDEERSGAPRNSSAGRPTPTRIGPALPTVDEVLAARDREVTT